MSIPISLGNREGAQHRAFAIGISVRAVPSLAAAGGPRGAGAPLRLPRRCAFRSRSSISSARRAAAATHCRRAAASGRRATSCDHRRRCTSARAAVAACGGCGGHRQRLASTRANVTAAAGHGGSGARQAGRAGVAGDAHGQRPGHLHHVHAHQAAARRAAGSQAGRHQGPPGADAPGEAPVSTLVQ